MKTIIHNGNIYIEKGVFANALLIENDSVSAFGTNEEILAMSDDATTLIDANGGAVIPGFNDSHLHLYSLGVSLESVKLYGSTSVSEVISRAREFVKENNTPAGEFVVGRGWNQDYFTDEKRMLTKHDLDKISTEHPIVFNRACGHLATCNSKALEVCGITRDTPQIDGSEFYFGEDGEPNGIFTENAIKILLEDKYPVPSVEKRMQSINTAMDYALTQGITSIHTNDISFENYQDMYTAYSKVHESETPKIKTYHQCFFTNPTSFQGFIDAGFVTGKGDRSNKIGPLKMFVDGSLGAKTALLRNDYACDAGNRGITCMTQDELNAMVTLAHENDFQVGIHAIGDHAIEMVLNGYDSVLSGENPLRHGVIHCQITDRPLVERFLENDILAYVQPIFIHYDMYIVKERVGEELASSSYAFGDMNELGIKLSYGTDCPVEDLSTMDNIYCAVARKDLKSAPASGYYPEQGVCVEDAIDLYTRASAYASFEENEKGTLNKGFVADIAILSEDIFPLDIEKIREVKVLKTIINGQVVYSRT